MLRQYSCNTKEREAGGPNQHAEDCDEGRKEGLTQRFCERMGLAGDHSNASNAGLLGVNGCEG